jgi:hypothetical protein
MNIWIAIVVLVVLVGGALGGVVNALMTDNSFVLPKPEDGIWRAGIIGNVIVSAVAGLIAWGSVSPVAGVIICSISACEIKPADEKNLTLLTVGTLMTSILVGIAGARWLTSEIDKKIMQRQKEVIKNQRVQLDK